MENLKKRKSYVVDTPEYDQYEESDNTQDMLDLSGIAKSITANDLGRSL